MTATVSRVLRPDAYTPVFFAGALLSALLLPERAVWVAVAFLSAAAAPVFGSLDSAGRYWRFPLIMTALGCALGLSLVVSPRHQPVVVPPMMLASPLPVMEGVLVEDAALSSDGSVRYRLQVERIIADGASVSAEGTATLFARRGEEFPAGRRVHAVLSTETPFAGGSPLLRADEVWAVGWAAPRFEYRSRTREALFGMIDGMGYRAGGLFRALVTGSRAQLSRAQQANFRESGSSHLLALSGMHLGIIAAVVFGASRIVVGRRAAFLVTLLVAVGYVALVGARPSLVRALVMFAVAGGITLAHRSTDPVNVLALAAALPVTVAPYLAHELSFQLSVLSLAGIVALSPLVYRRLIRRLPRVIAAPLAAAVGAQLATAPLTLVVFGLLHPVAVVSSLLLVPLVTLFVWTGLIRLLAALLPAGVGGYAATGLGALLREQAALIHDLAGFFAHVPALAASPVVWAGVLTALALCAADGLDLFARRERGSLLVAALAHHTVEPGTQR